MTAGGPGGDGGHFRRRALSYNENLGREGCRLWAECQTSTFPPATWGLRLLLMEVPAGDPSSLSGLSCLPGQMEALFPCQ